MSEGAERLNIVADVMTQVGFSLFAHEGQDQKNALFLVCNSFHIELKVFILATAVQHLSDWCGHYGVHTQTVGLEGDTPEWLDELVKISMIEDADERRECVARTLAETAWKPDGEAKIMEGIGFIFTVAGAVHAQTSNCKHEHTDALSDWRPEFN